MVKLPLQQAAEAYDVVRRRSFLMLQTTCSQMVVGLEVGV
jgi:hypothetical protein